MRERVASQTDPPEPPLREALGLAPGEWARVRMRSARVLLAELRPGEDPHLPADRDLALCADVRAFPLPEVFGWLQRAGKSGLLHFVHEDHAKWVWFHGGEVSFAASNQRIDRLGHSLLRAGTISLDELRDAERSYRSGRRFGKILVERGLLSPRELWTGLQRQVEEIVRSLFSYPAGWLCFFDGEVQPDNVVRLSLPSQRLVEAGLRWRDELRRFVAALADARVRIEAVPHRRESLGGTERLIFEALGEVSAFGPLCRRIGLDPPTCARTLQLLHRAGAVRIRRVDDDPDTTQRVRRNDPGERLRAHVQDAVKLLGELAAALDAVAGGDGLRERFAGTVEEVAGRFPGLLAGVRPGRGATLDSELLIERALALPPERQGDVREALAALADYLEFEVKNHPAIADADAVLRSVEPLRAKLLA
ncbi:MAG: DUF4388 domain-containing protein [Deltaproteobacteria bacterium]|nr:DUF4388 domain-containing protein [Deltaproteobacteria bacterium]